MLLHDTADGFFCNTCITWSRPNLSHVIKDGAKKMFASRPAGRGLQTLFTQKPTPAFEHNPPPSEPAKATGGTFPRREKRPERDVDHSPSSSAEFTNQNSNNDSILTCLRAVDRKKNVPLPLPLRSIAN